MQARVPEIDYLKCVFILLMVAFHLVYIGDSYPYAKQVVYTFHMPGFLLISGYWASARKGWGGFLQKVGWIFVPYAVMEVGYVLMSHWLPVRERVEELSAALLLDKVFLHPLGPYWYLHTLMLCLLLHYGVSRYVRGGALAKLIVFGLCLYGLAECGLLSFSTAAYFGAGCAIRWCGLEFGQVFRASWLAAVPLVLLCLSPDHLDRGSWAGAGIVYLCFCLLLQSYRYLPARMCRAACFVGRNTLPVLLFSPVFTMLSKLFLPFFLSFDASGMAFMLVAVLLATAGSIGIAWLMDRLDVSPFFFGRKESLSR